MCLVHGMGINPGMVSSLFIHGVVDPGRPCSTRGVDPAVPCSAINHGSNNDDGGIITDLLHKCGDGIRGKLAINHVHYLLILERLHCISHVFEMLAGLLPVLFKHGAVFVHIKHCLSLSGLPACCFWFGFVSS